MAANKIPNWLARAGERDGPIYSAIVEALEAAIQAGELQPGERLPPQRTVAAWLGVDFTTVSRAYAAAQARGLAEGSVGRGTFVRARTEDDEAGMVDLSMNLPPPPAGLSLGRLLEETTSAILRRADASTLMSYHPGFGTLGQRLAGAQWLEPCLGAVPPERVLVSPGAQPALAAILATLCRPGDVVVAEPLTYPGFKAVAAQLGLRILACPTDALGPEPAALEAICAQERPAAVYLIPTLQNPVASTMDLTRRREVAQIVRAAGAWILEDDPYSRLMDDPPPALASFLPDRTFHVATLAKCLTPGLRIAYVVRPPGPEGERAALALRALALNPAPLMAAIATAWIREGVAETVLGAVRTEARARRALAAELLPQAFGGPDSLHVWLPLDDAASPERLRLAGHERGLALVTAEAFAVGEIGRQGVRVSLGGPRKRAVLQGALKALADLAQGAPAASRLVV